MKNTDDISFDYLANAKRSIPKRDLMPLINARIREDEAARKQMILLAAASIALLLINVAVFSYLGVQNGVNEETINGISELNNSFNLYQ